MNSIKRIIVLAAMLLGGFCGCIEGGTHGAIKRFGFNVSKFALQKSVDKVIRTNHNLIRDSIKDYYNDSTSYVTLSIVHGFDSFKYVFRYYGDSNYWDTSKESELFIAYAYDNFNRGGSEGNGGVGWTKFKLKKQIVDVFKVEFIQRLEKDLNIKSKEYD